MYFRIQITGVLCILIVSTLGCETLNIFKRQQIASASNPAPSTAQVDVEELENDLGAFEDYFELLITDAASRYRQNTENAASRKQITILKNQSVKRVRDFIFQENPLDALLDTWIYCERLNLYVNSQEANQYFGRDPVNAKSAFNLALQRIRNIAAKHLVEEDFKRIESYILQEAEANPILLAGDTGNIASQTPSAASQNLKAVRDLVTLPFAPLFTFQKVNETSNSFQEFNQIAERFTDVVESLPREIQFEGEGLILTVLEHPNTVNIMKSLEQTSSAAEELTKAADQITLVAQNWPNDVGEATRLALSEMNNAQPEIKNLLAEVQKTTDGFRGTLAEAQTTSQDISSLITGIDAAALSLKSTAVELQTVLTSVERITAPKVKDDSTPSKPFDPADYENASDSLRKTVLELQELLNQLEQTNTPPIVGEVETRLENLSQQTVSEGRSLIDFAFKRAVQLLIVAFVLASLLVLLWGLLKKRGVNSKTV
ncbi:MAG: hypothetical protein ACFCU1_10395 [Sumerlaeia bacterium]